MGTGLVLMSFVGEMTGLEIARHPVHDTTRDAADSCRGGVERRGRAAATDGKAGQHLLTSEPQGKARSDAIGGTCGLTRIHMA